jgi:predicted ATPase
MSASRRLKPFGMRRINGVTEWFAGEFASAREHLEQALAIFDPDRDRDLAFRFGQDIGVPALVYSALVLWALGEVDLARERADKLATRLAQSGHAATVAYGLMHFAMFEIQGRNLARAEPLALSLARVANEHQMPLFMSYSRSVGGWVEWRSGSRQAGLFEMRRGIADEREQFITAFAPLIAGSLAEAEAETAGEIDAAAVTISAAIADSERCGQHWFDAELHRIRGKILRKQNSADPAPAEEAFLTAIAIAQQQRARSFELRAALALAKLYRATGRDADAHAVLGPALEDFAPTREFPEIEEAKALLAG